MILDQINRPSTSTNGNNVHRATALEFVRLPCIQYWMLNVIGMQAIFEKLVYQCRFKVIYTKCFNVDNVQAFFNIIRLLNDTEINPRLHESLPFHVIDDEVVKMCMDPSEMHSLVPNL